MKIVEDTKKVLAKTLPGKAEVNKIEMWGPEVALYTKNPEPFFGTENYIAKTAFELKKRINLRVDKSKLMGVEEAKRKIEATIPKEAGVSVITFTPDFSEVVIEALKPGLVIGKGGETSKQIIKDTGWTPNIMRAPTQKSEILQGIRYHVNKHAGERKKFLQATAKNIYRDYDPSPNDWVRMTALGGFREVGRSCMLIETNHTKIIMDCGVNFSSSENAFPYLESLHFPMNEIDAIVLSHAHSDHSCFIPFLYKSGYEGPVYCTSPTRDLATLLQFDYIKVNAREGKPVPYGERDVKNAVTHAITRDYREVTDIAPDIRTTFHNAAHILGSSSVHLHLGDGAHNIVYSGDMKFGFTRLFNNMDIKYPRLETLIVESTYWSRNDSIPPREESEDELLHVIKETMQGDGNILIPVFSVGRGQEIMLVLENFFRKGLLDAKCYVDGLTKEASAIHTAYPEYLRQGVQRRILQNDNPFESEIFTFGSDKTKDEIIAEGNSIIIASSGMLNGGASLEYFYKMADDPKNTIIFVGFQGANTMGRKVQGGMKTLPISQKGKTRSLNINMRVETVEGFSGHSDRNQLVNYVRNLKPKPRRIITDHGDPSATVDFARYLGSKFKVNSSAMQNLDALRLR